MDQMTSLKSAWTLSERGRFERRTMDCSRMFLALCVSLGGFGCAKNHYYIEPNGQVTTVSHQPFFGIKKQSAQTAQIVEFPTQVQGAKIIASTPATQSAQVGVVNPGIPEAVVVQQPANAGTVSEPGLIAPNVSDNSGIQISGGIRKASDTTTPVQAGLLD
jgi:hypothetical protein